MAIEVLIRRVTKPGINALWLLYLPLIVPQISFLAGLQTLAIYIGIDGNLTAVVAVHIVFVLPYVFLSLSGPYRSWDRRYAIVAGTLGASSKRIFWRIRMPMLLKSALTALIAPSPFRSMQGT